MEAGEWAITSVWLPKSRAEQKAQPPLLFPWLKAGCAQALQNHPISPHSSEQQNC